MQNSAQLTEELFKLIEDHMKKTKAGLTTYQAKALRVILPTIIFRLMK